MSIGNPLSERQQLDTLTSLRFLAACLVVFFHWDIHQGFDGPWWFTNFVRNGPSAVGFFFVLSGFVLTYAYPELLARKSDSGIRNFLTSRLARIYPVYALALILSLPIFFYSAFHAHLRSFLSFVIGLVSVPLLIQSWLPNMALAWNSPAWSLSVEAFFYLFFPLIGRVMSTWGPLKAFLLSYGLVCVAGVLRHVLPTALAATGSLNQPSAESFIAFFPLLHLPTFMLGIALALAHRSTRPTSPRLSHTVLLAAMALLSAAFCCRSMLPPVLASEAVLALVYSMIILSGAQASRGPLAHQWLVLLGQASYAVYILHFPIMIWLTKVFEVFSLSPRVPRVILFSVFLLVLISGSVVTYKWFELPARRFVLGWLSKRTNSPHSAST